MTSIHPQIAAQMNLEPNNLVSIKLSINRDISIVIGIDTDLKNICEQLYGLRVKMLNYEFVFLMPISIFYTPHCQ